MKIRVENGHGNPLGMLEVPDETSWDGGITVEWRQRVQHTTNTYSMCLKQLVLNVQTVIPFGPCIRVKWKQAEILKRAKFLLPYEEIERWDKEKHDWREPRTTAQQVDANTKGVE